MAIFDQMERATWNTAGAVFGDSGQWRDLTAGPPPVFYTGAVLVNEPTETEGYQMGNRGADHYEITRPTIEYYAGTFPGLYEQVRGGSTSQLIAVTNTQAGTTVNYSVEAVKKAFDGDIYIAEVIRL